MAPKTKPAMPRVVILVNVHSSSKFFSFQSFFCHLTTLTQFKTIALQLSRVLPSQNCLA